MAGGREDLGDRRSERLQQDGQFALFEFASTSQGARTFTFDKECYVTVVRRAWPV